MSEAKRLTDDELAVIERALYPHGMALSDDARLWKERCQCVFDHAKCLRNEARQLREDRERLCGQVEALTPRPLTDEEIERLAEESMQELRRAGTIQWGWATQVAREDMRRTIRFLADKLPPCESAELAELRAKLESTEADRDQQRERSDRAERMAKLHEGNRDSALRDLNRERHQRKIVESICKREGVSAECSGGLRSVSGRVGVMVQRFKTEAAKSKNASDRLAAELAEVTASRDEWRRISTERDVATAEAANVVREAGEVLGAKVDELALYETAAAHLSDMVDERHVTIGRMASELTAAKEQLAAKERRLRDITGERDCLFRGYRAITAALITSGVPCYLNEEGRLSGEGIPRDGSDCVNTLAEDRDHWKDLAAKAADELAAVRKQRDGLVQQCRRAIWYASVGDAARANSIMQAALAAAKDDADHSVDANKMVEADDLSSFGKYLKEGLDAMGPFQIKPIYNASCDEIVLYLEDTPSFARQLTPDVTAFLATDDTRIVGIEIGGVQSLVSDASKTTDAEPTGFRAYATNRARSQTAGYAARGEQPPTLGSEEAQEQFECPECGGGCWGTSNPGTFTAGTDEQRLFCKGVPYSVGGDAYAYRHCGWSGTWPDVRASRKRREACESRTITC